MSAFELIARELERQDGATTAEYSVDELANAAACYAMERRYRGAVPRGIWALADGSWEPGDRMQQLVRAGALIAEAIDRLRGEAEDTACELGLV